MHKINVHNTILEFDETVINSSPFIRTLFTTEHMVKKDEDGIIVLNKFSMEEMKVYIKYCMTGKLEFPIQHVMDYLMHKIPTGYYEDAREEYYVAIYEDQWYEDRNMVPKDGEIVVDLIHQALLRSDSVLLWGS